MTATLNEGQVHSTLNTRSQHQGTEALEAFRAMPQRFDAVVTDQTMPHMTGEHFAREVRRIRPDMPIILTTGFSDLIAADLRESLGLREVVMKPLVSQELAQAIHRVFNSVVPWCMGLSRPTTASSG